MAEVFISYARQDEAAARRVAAALKATGAAVWWDEDLPAHRDYSQEIEGRLAEAEAVVVLWSAAAAKSQWVRAEADFARNAGKVVQASVDGSLPPMPFNQIQCADLKGWRGSRSHKGWAKLEASVAVLLGAETPAPRSKRNPSWRDLPWFAWAGAAALLLALLAIVMIPKIAGGEEDRPVVAVLPFNSIDRRDESLVAGIWEDTRQAISRNPQLLVLGPNSSEEIAQKGDDTARKLADYVVEAKVRSVGDRIRVSANLVRTKDGTEVWSENFDRRLDDVFALQTEIAAEIEGRIRGRLASRGGVMPEHIATSGEVYALYSDARTKIRKRQGQHFMSALDQLRQVVAKDPNFAPGWATLAVVKKFGAPGVHAASAESDARRAIALAPNLAAGHAALGFVLGRGPAAQASLRRALELDPNDIEALNWMANSLDPSRIKEKLEYYDRIIEIEPLWWPAVFNRTNLLFETGNFESLEKEIARLGSVGNEALASVIRMDLLTRKGDLSGAASLGLKRYPQASDNEKELIGAGLFGILMQLGHFDIADKIFPPPSDYVPYIRRNDPKALDMIEAQLPPEQFWTFGPLPVVSGRVYLLNNQGPRMAKRYRAAAANPAEFEKLVGPDGLVDVVPSLALALRTAGGEAEARDLLARAEAVAKARPPHNETDIALARIYAAAGRKDEAMQLLSRAVSRGWIPPYLPVHTDIALDPPLAELKGDPRFEKLRRQVLDFIAKERAELGKVRLAGP